MGFHRNSPNYNFLSKNHYFAMFFNLQANFGVISCQNWEKMPFQKYYDFKILLKIKSWSEKIDDSSIYGQIQRKYLSIIG